LAIGEWEDELEVVARPLFVVLIPSKRLVDCMSAGHYMGRVDEKAGTADIRSKGHADHAKLKMLTYRVLILVT
jgi:hypothetical protein